MVRRLAIPPLVLIVLGVLAAVLIDGTAGTVAAIMLIGVGCVVAVSAVFWEVGKSEERQRARENPPSDVST